MNNPQEQLFGNALNLIPQLGPLRLSHLLKHFKTFEAAWHATRAAYTTCGFNPKLVEQMVSQKQTIDPSLEFAKLGKLGIETVIVGSVEYPDLLREISAFPPVLYVRGKVDALNTPAIAMVGTRKMSDYGKLAASEIAAGLVNAGLTICSGLAFGVDAQVLTASINLGGLAIAVLASPLDNASIAPKSNFQLAQKIMEHGCLVSEYPLGAQVQKQNFPIRNRIIAGLSLGTVVVEADVDSGSLITANFALEQNREVFAVPGSIFSEVSRGSNNLIKKGAKLVSSYLDVCEELNLDLVPAPELELNSEISANERQILETLTREPTHVDNLARNLRMPAAELNSSLVMLEMKGRVRNLGGAKFSKIR
ncbi:MAG TPA: DNA-processing protein DprA [Patescibacteria group bacterium]|nr:DNA-processing protein DprA [Patescibacteria group bacterium]